MPTYTAFDWYEHAEYYDIVFDTTTPEEADFLEAVHREHGATEGRRVLEPACGSGRLVTELATRGWHVAGFDASPGMLRLARTKLDVAGVQAHLREGRMEAFEYERPFDLAHCLVSTFHYLMTEDDARGHLQCVARSLKPGGLYVLGIHLADYSDERRQRERWIGTRDGTEVVCNIQSWPPDRRKRTSQLRSRMIARERGASPEHLESRWTFRTYSHRQFRSLLRSVPEFDHVATYDFHHDIEYPTVFDGMQQDNVLVLRRV